MDAAPAAAVSLEESTELAGGISGVEVYSAHVLLELTTDEASAGAAVPLESIIVLEFVE